jgi:hypothetical protein
VGRLQCGEEGQGQVVSFSRPALKSKLVLKVASWVVSGEERRVRDRS